MRINIDIGDAGVQTAFNRLLAASRDFTPAMREIGERLISSTKDRFISETDPTGNAWAELSDTTIERKGHDKKLRGASGELSLNIIYQAARDHVLVGSPLEYASTQQFGAGRGEFGTTKGGSPIPWGDIPARPFLGVSEDDRDAIATAIRRHIATAWSP